MCCHCMRKDWERISVVVVVMNKRVTVMSANDDEVIYIVAFRNPK